MRTYIITGMGRSATTFLSECLIKNGVNMGKKMHGGKNGWTKENIDFMELNRKIYEEAGHEFGIEKMPPTKEKVLKLRDKFKEEAKKIVNKNKDEHWGVKEPRLTSTYPIILPEIFEVDDDPVVYIAIRKPKYIAKSLMEMKGCSYEEGVKTAKEYHR